MDWYNAQFGQGAFGGGTAAGLGNALGNYGGIQQAAQQMQQQFYPSYATGTTTSNVMSMEDWNRTVVTAQKAAKKLVKKTGKILLDLRREIDDWHGDVLCRAS